MQKKEKPKILFLASWYPHKLKPIQGIFIKKHAQSISKTCDVSVLSIIEDPTLKNKTFHTEFQIEDGIHTIRVYYKIGDLNNQFFMKSIKLFRILRGGFIGLKFINKKFGKPDIVHVNVIWPIGWLALFLKFYKKIPYIITEHWTGYLPVTGAYKGFVKKRIISLIIKHANLITTVSQSLGNTMKDLGLKNKYYVVPNVVEPRFFLEDIKRKNDKKIILHVSMLQNNQKNIEGLIKVIASISKIRNDFELRIIGDGVDREFLINLAKNLNMQKKIIFYGFQTDLELERHFQEADFLVLNSNYETFSVVTAEALASGIPVIVTKSGGPEEFVTRETGLIIEPQNPNQLKNAICVMLDHFHEYDKKKLREYVHSEFSSEMVGEKFLKIYDIVFSTP